MYQYVHHCYSLQSASIYTTCVCLHQFLLERGGACLMQECFEHFNSCPDIPLEARDTIGDGAFVYLGVVDWVDYLGLVRVDWLRYRVLS